MKGPGKGGPWTTWKFRLAMGSGLLLLVLLTRGFMVSTIGRHLVCDEQRGSADAILVDNFDVNYLLFERAAALYREGASSRVLVPVEVSSDGEAPNLVIA